jgi:hypothetical protein
MLRLNTGAHATREFCERTFKWKETVEKSGELVPKLDEKCQWLLTCRYQLAGCHALAAVSGVSKFSDHP